MERTEENGGGDDDESVETLLEEPPADAQSVEFVVQAGSWNIHGLADYKQASLLTTVFGANIDVLALCETHLVNSEQLVRWERQVQASERYVWFGRPAVRLSPGEHGRGSGGVGILVRKDWAQHATLLPECEHDRLLFIRLTLPGASFSIFFGVAYLVPLGTARFHENASVLEELDDRAERYQSQGMVCIMGDFNVHIAEYPSTLLNSHFDPNMRSSEPACLDASAGVPLPRRSVDPSGADCPGGVSAAGAAFVDRMDIAGLVVLNGLRDAGEGHMAVATCGLTSVIDFILVDSAHWQLMDSVAVQPAARAEVSSDHQLVTSAIRFHCRDPLANAAAASPLPPNAAALLISNTRYRTDPRGADH